MHNLVSISQVRKKKFRVYIDHERNNVMHRWMDLHHESSCEVNMCGIETDKELYEAVTRICLDHAHVKKTMSVNVLHQRLGHSSEELLKASVHHVHAVKRTNLVQVPKCEAWELSKSRRPPRKVMEDKERGAARPLEMVFWISTVQWSTASMAYYAAS